MKISFDTTIATTLLQYTLRMLTYDKLLICCCLAMTVAYPLSMHRKRAGAVADDHPNGHDALGPQEDVAPNPMPDAD